MIKSRLDDRGEERLLGLFVFTATFIVISALFIGLMVKTFNEGAASGNWRELKGYEVIGEVEYLMLSPEGGYNASDYIQDSWSYDGDDNMAFDGDAVSVRDCEAAIIRDNDLYWTEWTGLRESRYLDFIMISSEWGWWSGDYQPISYQAIAANQIKDTNQSVCSVIVGGNNYSLIVTAPGGPEYFDVMLWENIFRVQVGIPGGWDDLAETSMWTVLGQMLTAQLPDVDPIINLLIAVPFWASLGFMAIMIISRFIPLIGGG